MPGPQLVHPVPAGEIPAWGRALAHGFLIDPDDHDAQRRRQILAAVWEPDRAWGVRDRGRWVATLRTEPRTLTVPGGGAPAPVLGVDAVTNVTVAATHRRRGLLTELLVASLREARERGDVLSALIPSEWPIYGRFGYAPATISASYSLHRRRPGATVAGADLDRVREVERDAFAQVAAAVFDAARRASAGQIDRNAGWWERSLGQDGFPPPRDPPVHWLLHEGDDGPDGMLAWRATGAPHGLLAPGATVEVSTLATASGAAYRDLWAYLCGVDLVDEVRLTERPVDEPVRWLLGDARTLVMTEQVDFLWVRLLDVAGALAARRYAVSGELVLEVTDADPPECAAGRFRLVTDGETVRCEPTGDPAELELTQRALATVYLGGFRLGALPFAGSRERVPGALGRADAMFATPRAPWNATWF